MNRDNIRTKTDLAHILFADMVGYSRHSTEQQGQMRTLLRQILEASDTLQQAYTQRVIQVETGDGVVLAFFDHPASPLDCAIEIARLAKNRLPLRIGIHTGLVGFDRDARGQENLFGDGVNLAQRVMDCADAGHILLSRQAAEILLSVENYHDCLKAIGEFSIKHGSLFLYNFYDAAQNIGNPDRPASGLGRWIKRFLPAPAPMEFSSLPLTPLPSNGSSTPSESAHIAKAADAPGKTIPAQVLSDRPTAAIIYKRNTEPDGHILGLLENALREQGYRVFIDRHLEIGVEWAQEIERELRSADFVIPLISEAAIYSEMLEHELQIAQQAGKPRLLPVRIAFHGELPRNLGVILDPLQYTLWESEADDERLVDALIQAMRSAPERRRTEAIGGAVPLDSQYYIARDTDREFHAALARHDSIVLVKGARQMGKTSLLARGFQRAREQGMKVVSTDFQSFTEDELAAPESLIRALCRSLKMQLELHVSIAGAWDEDLSANQNLERFLLKHVLEKIPSPVVWGLDEVDRLFGRKYASEIFGLLRTWHNKRATEPNGPWNRLTLAMAYATEAHLFISDLNQSPFNVGTRLMLNDFTPSQIDELNARCDSPLKSPEERNRLMALLGGHPYLARKGLDAIQSGRLSLEQLENEADRDEGLFGDHLRRILVLISQDQEMLSGLITLLQSGKCESESFFYRLRSAGVAHGDTMQSLRFRCRLYETYLRRHLLKKRIPSLDTVHTKPL